MESDEEEEKQEEEEANDQILPSFHRPPLAVN